jgi:hypothetical protein
MPTPQVLQRHAIKRFQNNKAIQQLSTVLDTHIVFS